MRANIELGMATERSYPIAELLDGHAEGADGDLQRDFIRAFGGVSRTAGLARSLELIATKLGVDSVAIFVPKGAEEIEPAAAHPSPQGASRLADVARPLMASERGGLVRSRAPVAAVECAETQEVDRSSAAAVPLCEGKRPIGVLAVERRRGVCLERADVARLAVMARTLATTLSLHDAEEGDTRLGVDG